MGELRDGSNAATVGRPRTWMRSTACGPLRLILLGPGEHRKALQQAAQQT